MSQRSQRSQEKEAYRVIAHGSPGRPTCCAVECTRVGSVVVRVHEDTYSGPIIDQHGSPQIAGAVASAFSTSFIVGLYYLICYQLGARLPAGLSYLREFTRAMFTHWILAERATGVAPGGPPEGLIEGWVQVASETPDLENLSSEVLRKIWGRMREHVLEAIADTRLPLAEIMARSDPAWARIGTIVLKLDDVMEDAARPFVLITSYFDGITAAKCVVTTPITVPIFGECRVKGLRKYLYDLLRRAGRCSAVVQRLVESQEIFAPCSLIPRDAHAFLRDVPAIEALGIEVALPRWWKGLKQPEIRVRTRVGASAPTPIGIEARLDLDTAYVVGEHALTEAQWRLIQRGHDGLFHVGGEWVELTRARIEAALQAARRVEELRAKGGVTYAEALELTAARLPGDEPTASAASASAAVFEPGTWLDAALSAIERRDLRRGMEPGVRLRGDLFGYQRQGIAWLSTLMEVGAGACLADDMGLGKTMQVIALIVVLLRRQVPGPHLIVVPASLLNNWQREFERFAPTVDVGLVHGGDGEVGDAVPYVTLTSYGTLSRREWLQGREWGLVVLDEAQEIRNPKTSLAQTAKRLRSRMRVCLTGTPIENHVGDLWSIMDFLNPGLLGSEAEFRGWFGEHCQGPDGMAPLRRRVRPFILRRLKTDPAVALDLPSKVEMTVFCGMTALQAGLYGQTYAAMRAEFAAADSRTRQGIAFKVLTRLKQICDHPAIVLRDQVYDPGGSGKFIRLTELATSIAAAGDKMLVFTQYQTMVAPIAEHLERVFDRAGAMLDGETPLKKRQEIVADFQRDQGPPFLVLTFGVGGTGYTLTAASHVVFFDRWWNPAVENQAMDRAFRIGQTKGVVVHKFVCRGTLEERIDALISRKHEMVKGLFGGGDDSEVELSKLSGEELLSLIALDPSLANIDEA